MSKQWWCKYRSKCNYRFQVKQRYDVGLRVNEAVKETAEHVGENWPLKDFQ